MDLGLKGKRVLVTGSTAGIGFAAAEGFAREGAAVIINGRTAQRVEAGCTRLRQAVAGAEVRGVAADLSTATGVAALIEAAPDVDVLINNVGIFAPTAFESISDEEWLHFFQTNVMSGVRLSRHHFPRMKAR